MKNSIKDTKKPTTLVIMAAGMGSRFGGGIKQLEIVGECGQIIMDYSIHDALKAGFDKVVFIIRHDLEKDFREIIGNRIAKICKVEYAFQEIANVPNWFNPSENRAKPWGTGHAVLACKGIVNEPFVVINADDYYGIEAFQKIHDFLIENYDDKAKYCMAGFLLKNTLSDNGGVSRGVAKVDENEFLVSVKETQNIVRVENNVKNSATNNLANNAANNAKNNAANYAANNAANVAENSTANVAENYAVSMNGEIEEKIDLNSHVSMNMWGCPKNFVKELESEFEMFLKNLQNDDIKSEFLLPLVVDKLVKEKRITVKVLETCDKWFGVTYKEDKAAVVKAFAELVESGVYTKELY